LSTIPPTMASSIAKLTIVSVVFILFSTSVVAFQSNKVSLAFHRFSYGVTGRQHSFSSSPRSLHSATPNNEPEEGQNADAPKKRSPVKKAASKKSEESKAERIVGESNNFMLTADGHRIAYTQCLVENSNEVVVYLPNLADGRTSPSASQCKEYCVQNSLNFLCADWFGRGESSGKLMEATLTRWTNDTIAFLNEHMPDVKGGIGGAKAVLVGSGVGVWVSVLVAMRRPDLVRGIVGIGGDPDFTEDLLWKGLPEKTKNEIMERGYKEIQWGNKNATYPVTSTLIEDGRSNLVLRGGPRSLPIRCPVRLIHCMNDDEVPVETSLKLAECLESRNVVVTMPKEGLETVSIVNGIRQCFEFTEGYFVRT